MDPSLAQSLVLRGATCPIAHAPPVLGVVPIHSPGLERWDDTTGELPGKVQHGEPKLARFVSFTHIRVQDYRPVLA